MAKQMVSMRLEEDTREMIRALAERLNVSQAQVVDRAVGVFAREQASKDFEVMKEWVAGLAPETKQALARLAALQPHQRDN